MQLHRALAGEDDVGQLAARLIQGEGIVHGSLAGIDPAHNLELRRSRRVAAGPQHGRYGQDRNSTLHDRIFHSQA